jgi:single-strand DNA-binding protein
LNVVSLVGKIASEIRVQEFTKSGSEPKVKASFLIAVRRSGKDSEPDWIRIETWGRQAQNLIRFNGKGSRIAVSGRVRGQFYNPDGGERGGQLKSVIVADEIVYLTPPKTGQDLASATSEAGAKPARR